MTIESMTMMDAICALADRRGESAFVPMVKAETPAEPAVETMAKLLFRLYGQTSNGDWRDYADGAHEVLRVAATIPVSRLRRIAGL